MASARPQPQKREVETTEDMRSTQAGTPTRGHNAHSHLERQQFWTDGSQEAPAVAFEKCRASTNIAAAWFARIWRMAKFSSRRHKHTHGFCCWCEWVAFRGNMRKLLCARTRVPVSMKVLIATLTVEIMDREAKTRSALSCSPLRQMQRTQQGHTRGSTTAAPRPLWDASAPRVQALQESLLTRVWSACV